VEFHIKCEPGDIGPYVFCPGDQARAGKIAERMEGARLVAESRGYVVYTGRHEGTAMTVCGTGMGGPAVAIAVEELGRMGSHTFIRVGSCGVFQQGQGPGDVVIASGTVRFGGTGRSYLPPEFPAVPHFAVLRSLAKAAEDLRVPHSVGVGVAGDAFYAPRDDGLLGIAARTGLRFIEMESDTLFIVAACRGWRAGAIFASDGTPGETKPEWGEEAFRRGEGQAISVALRAMSALAREDGAV
jgi:uridine phosphorylase